MNTELDANNKRIAKNTLLLYFRMLIMLIIGLYTSRIVLNSLGVIDFGIYNVVGGVVAMFGFLTNSMGGATSRYITYYLGVGNIQLLKNIFGNIKTIHFILAILILIICETIGLYFFYCKLQIPQERITASFWVYQFSVLASIISVLNIPYNALIISHEKMSTFAYITLADSILKFASALLLTVLTSDKLIIYGLCILCIQLVDQYIYTSFCKKYFEETNSKYQYDKNIFKKIFSYAAWTMNGNLAVIGYTQGLNILLNLFFGTAINAARGIAIQVQNICQQFCTNFQMALNPQLTKSYAQGKLEYMHSLIIKSSKFSFYILSFIITPLIFETHIVLQTWLGIVPEHTINFLRLILITSLIYSLSNPIVVSVHATGRIKKFQIIEGSILLTIVPISYVALKYFKVQPEIVFIIHILIEIITQIFRLKIVLPMINMKIIDYLKFVLSPILQVCIFIPVIPLIINIYINESFERLFILGFSSICWSCLIILMIGCTKNERNFIFQKINLFNIKKSL